MSVLSKEVHKRIKQYRLCACEIRGEVRSESIHKAYIEMQKRFSAMELLADHGDLDHVDHKKLSEDIEEPYLLFALEARAELDTVDVIEVEAGVIFDD